MVDFLMTCWNCRYPCSLANSLRPPSSWLPYDREIHLRIHSFFTFNIRWGHYSGSACAVVPVIERFVQLVSIPFGVVLHRCWSHQQNNTKCQLHLILITATHNVPHNQFSTISAKMTSSSSQPSKAEQSQKTDRTAELAALRERVIQNRQQRASAKLEGVTSSNNTPGRFQQQNQPASDGLGPVQTETSILPQAQSIPGLSHQMPDERTPHEGHSQLKKPTGLDAPDHLNANDSEQSPGDITGSLMEHILSLVPSETAGKDTNDAMKAAYEVRPDVNTSSGTNGHAAAKVQDKTDHIAPSRALRGNDSTASKETHSTKSTVAPKEKSDTQSSIEEGEINSRPTPKGRIPVTESTSRAASCRKNPPTRAPTATSLVPTEPGAELHVPRSLEATRAPKHREARADTASANSSTSRPDRKHEHGRASLPARQGRQKDDTHITWEAYKAAPPPSSHNVYARPSRELPPRPASPVTPRPTEARDWETQRFDSQDPDLRDWLRFTGWNNPDFRKRELARLRRLEEIEHESAELRKQGEREKARLREECGEASQASHISDAGPRPPPLPPAPPRRAEDAEPAGYRMLGRYAVTSGMKRERGEDSDGDADGEFSAKYHRNNRNYRGSRASYHGYHHRAREDSREWPAREGTPTCIPLILSSYPQHARSASLPTAFRHIITNVLSFMPTAPPHLFLASSAQHTGTACSNRQLCPITNSLCPDRRGSGRLSPPRDFLESPPPRYLPQRHPRPRFLSPVGHPLPRDELDAGREADPYMTRDRPPPRHRPHRPSSSPPNGRGYKSSRFHKSGCGRRL